MICTTQVQNVFHHNIMPNFLTTTWIRLFDIFSLQVSRFAQLRIIVLTILKAFKVIFLILHYSTPLTLLHSTPLYSILLSLYSTPLYSTLLYSTPLYSTPLYSTPLHSILLYSISTPLHSTPLHSTPLHSTPLHSTLLWALCCAVLCFVVLVNYSDMFYTLPTVYGFHPDPIGDIYVHLCCCWHCHV